MGILGAAGVVFFAYHRVRRRLHGGAGSEESRSGTCRSASSDRSSSARSCMCCSPTSSAAWRRSRTSGPRAARRRSRSRSRSTWPATNGCRKLGHGRDSRRLLVRHPRHAPRPVARVLLDEPRRPGPADLLRGPSEVPDALQVEHRCSSSSPRLFAAFVPGRHRRRDDEHRHAVRLHPGVRGRLDHARAAGPISNAASRCRPSRWLRFSAS